MFCVTGVASGLKCYACGGEDEPGCVLPAFPGHVTTCPPDKDHCSVSIECHKVTPVICKQYLHWSY